MLICWFDQSPRFHVLLKTMMATPVMTFDKRDLKEKVSSVTVSDKTLGEIDTDFFLDYNIFPPDIMVSLTQWKLESRTMQVGDTILQQVHIPPFSSFSQKIIFGVRINNVIDEPHRKGFSYQTLEGHVEKGESSFVIEQTEAGLTFSIHTFSMSGNMLTRLCAPFFTIPYQTYCTNKALEHVKKQILEQ